MACAVVGQMIVGTIKLGPVFFLRFAHLFPVLSSAIAVLSRTVSSAMVDFWTGKNLRLPLNSGPKIPICIAEVRCGVTIVHRPGQKQ
jgi:hypothetical protein